MVQVLWTIVHLTDTIGSGTVWVNELLSITGKALYVLNPRFTELEKSSLDLHDIAVNHLSLAAKGVNAESGKSVAVSS